MKFIKRIVWPIIVGCLAVWVFISVMNLAYELLTFLSEFPIFRFLLLLNKSILGVDIITADSFVLGSLAAMLFMSFLTKYDKEDGKCYVIASRTCGVGCIIITIASFYVLITAGALTFTTFSMLIPYIIFDIILIIGKKFG